jgi:hypothetical protein
MRRDYTVTDSSPDIPPATPLNDQQREASVATAELLAKVLAGC